MDIKLIQNFTEALIKRTLDHELAWCKLAPIKHEECDSNYPLYMKLFENEFHKITYNESQMLHTPYGVLYLVYEWFESGRDGTISEGYSLYFQKDLSEEVHEIDIDSDDLYRLKNAINSYLSSKENDVISFIEAFLASE